MSQIQGLFIWARSTGLAWFPRSRLATLFFVKISMCSFERPAGPVTETSVFAIDISVTGMKIFPYEHSSPVTGTKLFKQNYSVALTTYRPKWHNFGLVCIFSLGVCELALLVKLQDSTKPWQSRRIQVYAPPFWLCFLNSLRSTGPKFPVWTHHRIRHDNRASPVKGHIWRGPQFRDSLDSDKQKLTTLEYPDIRR